MQKMDEDALAAGGTLKIKNTAVWAYSEPTEVEVEHKIPIIEKDYTVKMICPGGLACKLSFRGIFCNFT